MVIRKLISIISEPIYQQSPHLRSSRTDVMVGDEINRAASLDAKIEELDRHIQGVRGWVGGLLGTEDHSLVEREREHEAELVEAERQLMSSLTRLDGLKELRASLNFASQRCRTQ